MASTIKVDNIEGSTGSTITVPTGQTLTLTDGLAVASLPTVTVAKGGTGIPGGFTAGDVLYATGATTLAKLPKGTAEQILSMNSGATAPEWTSVDVSVGGTGLASFTAGDILYATGATTLAKLAKGSAAEVMTMNAGATAPEWAASAGGGLDATSTFANGGNVFYNRWNTQQTTSSTTYVDITASVWTSIGTGALSANKKIWFQYKVQGVFEATGDYYLKSYKSIDNGSNYTEISTNGGGEQHYESHGVHDNWDTYSFIGWDIIPFSSGETPAFKLMMKRASSSNPFRVNYDEDNDTNTGIYSIMSAIVMA